MANKGFRIPQQVGEVISAVFLDRSHTMKYLKFEEEFAYSEFRKWLTEAKTKLKKDPIPMAKVELSKVRYQKIFLVILLWYFVELTFFVHFLFIQSWLEKHPHLSSLYRFSNYRRGGRIITKPYNDKRRDVPPYPKPTKPPMVVLDECTDILLNKDANDFQKALNSLSVGLNSNTNKNSIITSSEKKAGGGTSASSVTTGGNPVEVPDKLTKPANNNSPLNTPSILNWNKSQAELLVNTFAAATPGWMYDSLSDRQRQADSEESALINRGKMGNLFTIDEHAMFLQNNCPNEYFIAL